MPKKILDIFPPQKPEKKESFFKGKELKANMSLPPKKTWRRPSFLKIEFKKSLIFVAFVLIFIIILGFSVSKAEIKIWPETQAVSFKTEITVDKDIESSDFENKTIPGQIFEVEKTISKEFLASGKVLKGSEGIIRLYNAYSTQTENWLSGTRFVSTEGKLFKSKGRITVPGAEMKNGKIIPSFVDVPVMAAEPGSDYNIGSSHFSVVAYRGTSRYTKFYGESFQAMIGGGEAPQVTEKDIEDAQSILVDEAEAEAIIALRKEIPDDFLFLRDTAEATILEKSSLVEEGAEVEKFNYQVKARAITITFKKEEVNNFVEEFILSQIPKGELLYLQSLKINYSPTLINFGLGQLTLSLDFSAKIYPQLDLELFKKELVGKSKPETEFFLESYPEIVQTEAHFWPFWVQKVPKDIEKIKIDYPIIETSI
jgi:hypothetical protein